MTETSKPQPASLGDFLKLHNLLPAQGPAALPEKETLKDIEEEYERARLEQEEIDLARERSHMAYCNELALQGRFEERMRHQMKRIEDDALAISIRALTGELLAELEVNGRCTAGQLAEELTKLVPPAPRSEYKMAVETQALEHHDRLCDHVIDGDELTALVVESRAGEYFCRVSPTREVVICLAVTRKAFSQAEMKIGGLNFDLAPQTAHGYWEDLDEGRLRVVLEQTIGSLGAEFQLRHCLELEQTNQGDLRVIDNSLSGGDVNPNITLGSKGQIYESF